MLVMLVLALLMFVAPLAVATVLVVVAPSVALMVVLAMSLPLLFAARAATILRVVGMI